MLTETEVKVKLKEVLDPEIQISVIDLGLVYGVQIEGEKVTVKMTLTSPMCPLGPQILNDVKMKISELPEAKEVNVDLIWSPAWDPQTMASDEAKIQLGIE